MLNSQCIGEVLTLSIKTGIRFMFKFLFTKNLGTRLQIRILHSILMVFSSYLNFKHFNVPEKF